MIIGLFFKILIVVFFFIWVLRFFRRTIVENEIARIHLALSFLISFYFLPAGVFNLFGFLKKLLEQITWTLTSAFAKDQKLDSLLEESGGVGLATAEQLWPVILFLLSFLCLAYIFKRTFDNTGQLARSKVFNFQIKWVNSIIIVILFAFSIFLSLSSIVAVPIMNNQETSTSAYTSVLAAEVSSYKTQDSLERLKMIQFAHTTLERLSTDSTVNQDNLVLLEALIDLEADVNNTYDELYALGERAKRQMQLIDYASISDKLKLKDKGKLSNWYLDNRLTLLRNLDSRRRLFKVGTGILQSGVLQEALAEEDIDAAMLSQILMMSSQFDKDIFSKLLRSSLPTLDPIPERSTLGSDLGIFTLFTGWLLRIESYPLALIIGLVGFGLLGAAGGAFIQKRINEDPSQEKSYFVDDMAGVLIRGFTAAIVIFLGVNGGLAILTNNANELNAYALFFLTFVAAVYSDSAWNWAKARFERDLQVSDGKPKAK